jgi:hypothetical protein
VFLVLFSVIDGPRFLGIRPRLLPLSGRWNALSGILSGAAGPLRRRRPFLPLTLVGTAGDFKHLFDRVSTRFVAQC